MMVTIDNLEVMNILANATNTISEGEVLQLLNIGNLDITENQYFQVIKNKTTQLFEAGCELAALICEQDKATIEKMALYGEYL